MKWVILLEVQRDDAASYMTTCGLDSVLGMALLANCVAHGYRVRGRPELSLSTELRHVSRDTRVPGKTLQAVDSESSGRPLTR